MMRKLLILISALGCISASPAFAQTTYNKGEIHGGGGPGFNQSTTSDFANTSYHFIGGGGYNFSESIGATGEYMYYHLSIKEQPGLTDRSGHLGGYIGNVMFRTTSKLGFYGIFGAGYYKRSVNSGQSTALPAGSPCPAVLVWWNVPCSGGVTTTAATVDHQSDWAWGINVGGGVNFPLKGRLKGYSDVRFHNIYNEHVSTRILPWTFGVRW